mmetsp:Transcript_28799/g.48576  ORF Transcript_28799/g.48576 Transcript_28799/m.48576 type:complete len:266 (+) Transcript_28799:174-971(+)
MSTFATLTTSVDTSHKDIAVFGLSGNPPTGECGHAGIVRYLVQSGEFHEIWVLPVFKHQFASKDSLISFEVRVAMCQLAFEEYSSDKCTVRVLTLERDVEEVVPRHGTVDTLTYIKGRCPQVRLHLILGSDTYNDIAKGKWRRGETLFSLATLHVIERIHPHGPTLLHTKHLSEVHVHDVSWLSEVSSSSLRLSNPYPLWPLSLPPCLKPCVFLDNTDNIQLQVYDYIKSNQIFFYSSVYLSAVKRCRLTMLGFIGLGLLKCITY